MVEYDYLGGVTEEDVDELGAFVNEFAKKSLNGLTNSTWIFFLVILDTCDSPILSKSESAIDLDIQGSKYKSSGRISEAFY